MTILEKLSEFRQEKNLEFLVIGGHAVISHGYSRRTLDLDILIPKADGPIWKGYVLSLGYNLLFKRTISFSARLQNGLRGRLIS